MTPVILLSDGYIANGSEPWQLPRGRGPARPARSSSAPIPEGFLPYLRDPETLARPWAIPGTPGLEHRIGGLEKQDVTGNVSYEPANHEHMVHLRAEKVARIANDIPDVEVDGDPTAATCWCSAGAAPTARSPAPCSAARASGLQRRPRAPALPEPVPARTSARC